MKYPATLNLIAFAVYCVVHWVDRLESAAAKFTGSAKDLKAAANAFNTSANLDKFKAASAALQTAGQALLDFATELASITRVASDSAVTTALKTAANANGTNNFKNASKGTSGGNSGFYKVADQLGSDFTRVATAFFAAYINFNNVSTTYNFADAADSFADAASDFNKAAQTYNDDTQLSNIKATFQQATNIFNNAATTLYGQIKNKLWLWPWE